MNEELQKQMAFDREYLKDKNITEVLKTAVSYCVANKLISRQEIATAQASGREALNKLGAKAVTAYLRKLYMEQQKEKG